MKELFETVRTALIATGDWKYIDIQDGQLDNGEEFALLPSALVDIDAAEWQAGDLTYQVGMMRFNVEYAFRRLASGSNLSNTKSYTLISTRFDTVKAASIALVGLSGDTHGKISRIRTERVKHREYWIIREVYLCTVMDSLEPPVVIPLGD